MNGVTATSLPRSFETSGLILEIGNIKRYNLAFETIIESGKVVIIVAAEDIVA